MFGTTDVSAELLAPLSYDVIRGVLGVVCGGGRGFTGVEFRKQR